MSKYSDFIATKEVSASESGFDVSVDEIHPMLFDWQREVVTWALRLGKAALYEECGMGKTLQQLEWARHVANFTGGKVLICAPLAVAHQTIAEGAKIGVPVKYVRSGSSFAASVESVCITNYDMLKEFAGQEYAGVVLDEAGILKSYTGTTKRMILEMFDTVAYKLACTATPAPNDHLELGNQAQFLNVMDSNEMISRWFINDTMQAGHYRLKAHAAHDFWRWMTTWAVSISKPSDLGYADDGFILPELHITEQRVSVDHTRAWADGKLFITDALSATTMWEEKRETLHERCERAREIVATIDPSEPIAVWCDTNAEADELKRLFPEAVEVRGSDTIKQKEDRLDAFIDGKTRMLISKCEIAGYGLNMQHCHNTIFVGISYSFEKLYQALRRFYRFRQEHDVEAHLIYAETEGNILKALKDKQDAHHMMQGEMNKAMREHGLGIHKKLTLSDYKPGVTMEIPQWLR